MKGKSLISILLVVMLCVTMFAPGIGRPTETYAASSGILIEKEGWLDYASSTTDAFELTHKADLKLTMSDYCRGEFTAKVINSDTEEIMYTFEDSLYYEDQPVVYNMSLSAGNYELIVSTAENREFEYEYTLSYQEVVDYENPDFSISQTEMALYPEDGQWLYINAEPEDIEMPEILWSSNNTAVAQVSELGYVTAVAPGEAVISATVGGETFNCSVTVNKINYYLSSTEKTIYEKQTAKLTVSTDREDYAIGEINWSSSNTAVAKVAQDGTVTAVAKGTAVITANIGSEAVSCKVTVKAMALNYSSATVYIKKTKTLKVNGGSGTIKWSTSNKKVATVTSSGVVKGVAKGTAYIYAKRNGKTLKCKVTVKWEPETGKVVTKTYDLPDGGNEDKKFVLSGKSTVVINAVNNGMGSNSYDSDSLYITVDKSNYDEVWSDFLYDGESLTKTLTLSKGTYYLYYDTTNDCDISMKITTKPQISKSSMTVAKGYKRDLNVAGVKNGGKWSTSNKKIATVNSNGLVKGVKKGTCYIKYTLKTGKVLKCKITVKAPVTCKVTYVDNVPIYNDCYVKFTNNTGKKISYIKFNIKQYNYSGKRVYGPYDWYYVDDYLAAYSSDEWHFWVHNNARRCKAYITKVYFTDGTTWKP